MGWGIRGQYGHETGAMIAGLLLSLVFARLFVPQASLPAVARAVAWGTIAMGFGGSMTYGQTIGLTQNPAVLGNWSALGWGMLGLSIKGAIWIGFAGAFLGMGLSGRRYRSSEVLGLMLGLLGLFWLGTALLNAPFDPAKRLLPAVYFSADWRWEPGATLTPRREVWGGLLPALLGVMAYAGWRRRDRLAWNLGLWGMGAGAVGFPLGQCLQAYHAWNAAAFARGPWAAMDPLINWWNMMEITFGAVAGAGLGLGLWLNRDRIQLAPGPNRSAIRPSLAWTLLVLHLALLIAVEFRDWRGVNAVYDLGLVMGIIPLVAVAGSRWWAFAVVFPLTALPIAGKTLVQLVDEERVQGAGWGWTLYVVVPLALTTWAAIHWARRADRTLTASAFTRFALLLSTWLYFGLNLGFFHYPWPWATWTSRTPSAVIFSITAAGLTWVALRRCPSRGSGAGQGA